MTILFIYLIHVFAVFQIRIWPSLIKDYDAYISCIWRDICNLYKNYIVITYSKSYPTRNMMKHVHPIASNRKIVHPLHPLHPFTSSSFFFTLVAIFLPHPASRRSVKKHRLTFSAIRFRRSRKVSSPAAPNIRKPATNLQAEGWQGNGHVYL